LKGHLNGPVMPLVTSFVVNFILALVWASYEGLPINQTAVYAVAQLVASTIYQEFKSTSTLK